MQEFLRSADADDPLLKGIIAAEEDTRGIGSIFLRLAPSAGFGFHDSVDADRTGVFVVSARRAGDDDFPVNLLLAFSASSSSRPLPLFSAALFHASASASALFAMDNPRPGTPLTPPHPFPLCCWPSKTML